MHNCPRCGNPTDGAFSEGGIRWAICEDCMNDDRRREDDEDTAQPLSIHTPNLSHDEFEIFVKLATQNIMHDITTRFLVLPVEFQEELACNLICELEAYLISSQSAFTSSRKENRENRCRWL